MKAEWRRRLILGFALVAALFFLAVVFFHPLLALGVLFLSHLLILFPTLVANCQWWGPVITSFATPRREVWLTIDDGPHPADTPAFLAQLARYKARATFFVKGERAEKYPELIRAIVRHGHTLGNHTYSHPSGSFWALPKTRLRSEIDGCSEVLSDINGVAPSIFRAPAGMKNFFVHPLLAERELQLIGWSARGLDTAAHEVDRVVERIFRKLRPGGIVLLHEDTPISESCLDRFLARATAEGYTLVIPNPEQFLEPL